MELIRLMESFVISYTGCNQVHLGQAEMKDLQCSVGWEEQT